MSSAIKTITLTLSGQPITGISVPIGSSVLWDLFILDPFTLSAYNLSGTTVVLAMSQLLPSGQIPVSPPILARQATIISAPAGHAQVSWVPADTAPIFAPWTPLTSFALGVGVTNGANSYVCTQAGTSAVSGGPTGTGSGIVDGTCQWSFFSAATPLPPGQYDLEVWLTDAQNNRLASFPAGPLTLTPASFLPFGTVVPLPPQQPQTDAFGVHYSPTTPSNWNPVPSNGGAALDDLAAGMPPHRNFFRASFSGVSSTSTIDYSSLTLSSPPAHVLAFEPVTDSIFGINVQVELSSITTTGCTIQSNDSTWTGYVDVEIIK
jgi:hypothetical protein